jgi:poly(A) polymerase
VDPHDGRGDLERSILRTPLDPEVSFSDDPLRMLRAARFHAALGLVPVEPLTSAISEMGDRMAIVSAERIRDELQKLLLLERAADGLRLLHRTRLLGRVVEALDGLTAGEVDVLGRRVEEQAAAPARRWAALLFDVHSIGAALGPLKPSGRLSREITWLVADRAWFGSVPHDAQTMRRAASEAPVGHVIEERLDFFAALRTADGAAGNDIAAAREFAAALRTAEPDLDDPGPVLSGEVVCGLLDLEPGPDVGVALGWLAEQRIVEGPLDPDDARERLLDWWNSRPPA